MLVGVAHYYLRRQLLLREDLLQERGLRGRRIEAPWILA